MKKAILFVSCSLFSLLHLLNAQNLWIQKANFGGAVRGGAVGFSVGNKGYIGTGKDNNPYTCLQDFWEWDQTTNTWSQKASFGGGIRCYATGFSIGNKGYLGTGSTTSTLTKD